MAIALITWPVAPAPTPIAIGFNVDKSTPPPVAPVTPLSPPYGKLFQCKQPSPILNL